MIWYARHYIDMASNVSILIPHYNGEHFLTEALASVAAQTYPHIEVIIIDDCSTDGSWERIAPFLQDSRFRAIRHEQNQGIYTTRNQLVREVSDDTTYVALFDSDDVMESNRIATQVAYLDAHPDVSVVGSDVVIIDEDGVAGDVREYPETHTAIARGLLVRNTIAQPAVLMRRDVYTRVGMYDESLARVGDLDFWARVIRAGCTCATIKEPLTCYRIHKSEGAWARPKTHLACAIRVRMRHLWSRELFSVRACMSLCAYVGAYVLPSVVLKPLARVVVGQK